MSCPGNWQPPCEPWWTRTTGRRAAPRPSSGRQETRSPARQRPRRASTRRSADDEAQPDPRREGGPVTTLPVLGVRTRATRLSRRLSDAEVRERRLKRRIGTIWGLLILNVLSFAPGVSVIP